MEEQMGESPSGRAEDGPVRYEQGDGVATVTLNRPDRLNALSSELIDALLSRVEQATSDAGVRVLMLTGAGRGFCVGGDLQRFSAGTQGELPEATRVGTLRRSMRVSQLLREADVVTVAAVNGACAGAGLSLALACDLRVASDTAVLRTAFLTAGLSGDFGGTWSLTHLLGEARAKELYLLNEKLTADEALRLGLVSRVFPAAEFAAQARALAERLAAQAPVALRSMKQNLTDASRVSFAEACDHEAQRHIACSLTGDAVEAATAFLERRPPVFTGA
jgi:2-(1,2-epoxy-1,2-dihydrophenyl)acetyl-CoA isomerase